MQSRIEDILQAILDGTLVSELPPPQSRNEALLMQILENSAASATSAVAFHICGRDEYDPITGTPIIAGPEENTFYLVPNNSDTTDLYDEWIWINEAWEQFGTGTYGYVLTDADKQEIAGIVVDELPAARGVSF